MITHGIKLYEHSADDTFGSLNDVSNPDVTVTILQSVFVFVYNRETHYSCYYINCIFIWTEMSVASVSDLAFKKQFRIEDYIQNINWK